MGPPPTVEFGLGDFAVSGIGVGTAIEISLLARKIEAWARSGAFGLYCEETHPDDASWTAWQCVTYRAPVNSQADAFIPIPPGCDLVQYQAGPGVIHSRGDGASYLYWSAGGTVNPGDEIRRFNTGSFAQEAPATALAVGSWDAMYVNFKFDYEVTWCFRFHGNFGGTPTPYDGPAPGEPPGLVAPASHAYETIQDLGDELDRQEIKLDLLGQRVDFLTRVADPALTGVSDALNTPIDAGEDPILVGLAIGAIVTLATIPNWADEDFGTPARLHRLGYVNLGSDVAWLPPQDLNVSPMLLSFPVGVTRIKVTAPVGVNASVLLLYPKPTE
jgi:hypothetical protein